MKPADLFAPVAPPSWLVPLSVGALGSLILTAVYMGLVALAESPARALEQWWDERAFNVPIVLGFGIQLGLYTVLRRERSVARAAGGSVGAAPAASGSASTLAMVACCTHRVADLLPIVGIGAGRRRLHHVRWMIVRQMGLAWLITIPASAVLAMAVFAVWGTLA